MSEFRRRLIIAMKISKLPSEYQLLDYIPITSGSKYFDTGFVPTIKTKVEITLSKKATGGIFGCRNGWNNKSFYLYTGGNSSSKTFHLAWSSERTATVTIDENAKNIFGIDGGRFYVNNTTIGTYSDSFSPVYSLFLLRINSAGTVFNTVGGPSGAYLHGSQIWDDDVLVRDYVPVNRLSDNVKGIYDLVNGTFLN